jgi:hypothetical protein
MVNAELQVLQRPGPLGNAIREVLALVGYSRYPDRSQSLTLPSKESVVAITLAKTLRLLAAEKKAVLQRQMALVANLNKLLPSIGYRVVPLEDEERMRARSNLRGGRRSTTLTGRPLLNKSLVCRYCQRTFALPLHLGRHISVMHRNKNASSPPAHSLAGGEHPAKPTRRSRGQAARRRARGRSRRTTAKKTARRALTTRQGKG